MQMGHMRFEPNINVHITDDHGNVHKTAITEIKNLNSFSVLERATEYEIRRQIHQWQETGSLGKKSTYGWDESSETTFHQRDKEEAHDYRYFPDPDLMPVIVNDAWLSELKSQISELPAARHRRYTEKLKLSVNDATTLSANRETGDLYDQTIAAGADPKRTANLLLSHARRISNERNIPLGRLGLRPNRLAELAQLIDQNKLAASEPAGKVMEAMLERDESPQTLAQSLGLLQLSDESAIDSAIDSVLAKNPQPLQDYRSGKQAAMGALVGMVMKSVRGLNPKVVQERLKKKLD